MYNDHFKYHATSYGSIVTAFALMSVLAMQQVTEYL